MLGIDSGYLEMGLRTHLWERLATELKPAKLFDIAHEVGLDELPTVLDTILKGGVTGRYLIRMD